MTDNNKTGLRVGAYVLIALAAVVLAGAIWFFLPLRHPLDTRVEPYDVVGYFETSLNKDTGAGAFAVELADRRVLGEDSGLLTRFAFRAATTTAFPTSVNGWLVAEPGETLPAAVAVIDIGRSVRALRLVQRIALPRVLFGGASRVERVGGYRLRTVAELPSATPIAAYAFIGDSFVVSTSRAVLSSLFHALESGAAVVRPEVAEALGGSGSEIQAYMTNGSGSLTGVVRGAEERVAFAALPSVDALASIHTEADIVATEEGGYRLSTSTRFIHTDPERAWEVYSDARFLYGTLRRVARAQEIELSGEIVEDDDSVTLNLAADGLEALFESPEDEEM